VAISAWMVSAGRPFWVGTVKGGGSVAVKPPERYSVRRIRVRYADPRRGAVLALIRDLCRHAEPQNFSRPK
jgi:hypothetical protein